MAKTLTGKVALVTGGSRGLGAAMARSARFAIAFRLAQDGAVVALTYTSSPQKADEVVLAIESAGGKALAILASPSTTFNLARLTPI